MINDPNEVIARLYPIEVEQAQNSALTITQADGTVKTYDGTAPVSVTIDSSEREALTVNMPDGSQVVYDGDEAKTVNIPSTMTPTDGSVSYNSLNLDMKQRYQELYNNEMNDRIDIDNLIAWASANDEKFYNVVDFGAKGDGSTDDTLALRRAFEATNPGGGIVFFPPGTYVIGGGGNKKYVEFYSNTRIIGIPGKSVLIYADALADSGTSWSKPKSLLRNKTLSSEEKYTSTHDVIIEGLVFDGNPRIPKSSTALGIGHALNITVRDCIFRNHYSLIPNSHYIEINASRHVVVDGCIFEPEYHLANNISDKSKWDCIYAEYINLDRASENSYGSSSYYAWDNTEPDDIEIMNCKFMSFPSDYWSHPRELAASEIYWSTPAMDPNRTAANVFYGLAIGGHADYGENYAGNRGEAATNVKIHDNLFLGDWNSSVITDGTTQPARRYTINATNMQGECDGWVIRNNVFIAANKNASSVSTNRKACGINLNTAKIHNYIFGNTFLYYDAGELLYHGAGGPTSTTAKYWNNVNMADDGTTTVKGNLPSPIT